MPGFFSSDSEAQASWVPWLAGAVPLGYYVAGASGYGGFGEEGSFLAAARLFDVTYPPGAPISVLLAAPLLTGYVRMLKARLQRRRGPPVAQPWRDLARLARKEAVVAHDASWLFRSAPYLIFAMTWVAADRSKSSSTQRIWNIMPGPWALPG